MVTENEIRELIRSELDAEYTGKIRIIMEDGWYNLLLYFNNQWKPKIVISIESEDDNVFKKYICSELHKRHLEIVHSWRLDKHPVCNE